MLNKNIVFVFLFIFCSIPALFSQSYNMVKDIKPGSGSSLDWANPFYIPQLIGSIQNKLLILVQGNGSFTRELWISDGTESGTIKVSEKNPAIEIYLIKNDLNLAFFSFNEGTDSSAVYQFDGNDLVKIANGGEYHPQEMTYLNDKLYYVASLGSSSFDNCLVTPSGDVQNPTCVMEINDPLAAGVTAFNNQIIGIGEIPPFDPYLFRSDGISSVNSEFYFDLTANSGNNNNANWIEGDGQLFFFYQPGGAPTPMGLYVTDGTEAGTQYLADLRNNGVYPKNNKDQVFYQGNLIVGGLDENADFGRELYRSDGTPNGTYLLKDINPDGDSEPYHFVEYNDLIYFVAVDDSGEKQVWQTDGTEAGTVPSLPTLFAGSNNFSGEYLTVYDNLLAFIGYNDAEGKEIWLSDGTPAGTYPITDESLPGENDFNPEELFALNNNLFFTAYESSTGRELYVYNNGQPNGFLSAAASNIACDDNETNMNANDDLIIFDLATTASGLSNTFTLNAVGATVTPNNGTYNQTSSFSLQPGSAGNGDITVTITDSSDPDWTSTVQIADPGICSEAVGINELNTNHSYLKVHPNPFFSSVVFETLNLNISESYSLELFSSTGKLLKTVDLSSSDKLQLDLSVYKSVFLFYQLRNKSNGQTIQTGKLIGL